MTMEVSEGKQDEANVTDKKPFNKKKWREQRYSCKAKVQKWENIKKKQFQRQYIKECKKLGTNLKTKQGNANLTDRKTDINEEHLRHCILYEFNKGTSAAQAVRNICALYGSNVLDDRKCRRWFAKFSSGNFDLKDSPRSGRPKSIDKDALQAYMEANPMSTSRQLAQEFKTTHTTIISSLRKLGKVSKLGTWVPHILNDDQENINNNK